MVGYKDTSTDELAEVRYEYEKAMRLKESLQKGFDRRKKLNLLDNVSEKEMLEEIRQAEEHAGYLRRKYRSVESQRTRSKIISESDTKASWEK